jgi:hypothetical protein
MEDERNNLENLWDNILSGQPGRIRGAFFALNEETQEFILNHLQRMVTEEGWQPEQQLSARAALDAITAR